MNRQVYALAGLVGVVCFLLGLVASQSIAPGTQLAAIDRPAGLDPKPLTVSISPSEIAAAPPAAGALDFAAVAERLNSAVVNIDAATRVSDDRSRGRLLQPRDLSNDGGSREGAGSGFIIDPAGFILTNNHVVTFAGRLADRVTVTLSDGRTFKAAVVGVDPAIDLALLQINVPERLPVASLGDSDSLRVGEWVCAIGNPLGYVHSVTVGVVSFLGRKLFDSSLDAFIQTDAAINFGNSGGPLINARGQVVGITTAITAQPPNIGFALPINQAIAVLPQLRERGRVSRGYLGVDLRDAPPELQRALRLGPAPGALVQDVSADTPADHAGLRAYDLIVAADGRPMRSRAELERYILSRAPGTVTRLEVRRDAATMTLPVRLGERRLPPQLAAVQVPGAQAVRPAAANQNPLGLTLQPLDDSAARRFPNSIAGLLITTVDPAGPARLAGVRPGQVLLEFNRRRVTSMAELQAVLARVKAGDAVALFVYDPLTEQRAIFSVVLDPAS